MTDQVLVFTLDDLSYALPLKKVEKVIHAVEIRPLPNAPGIIAGIINIKGQIIPVADIRRRFNLPACELNLSDRLIITASGKRQVAILVDKVDGIRDLAHEYLLVANDSSVYPENITGVMKTDEGTILIYNLDRFLSMDDEGKLEEALKKSIDVS